MKAMQEVDASDDDREMRSLACAVSECLDGHGFTIAADVLTVCLSIAVAEGSETLDQAIANVDAAAGLMEAMIRETWPNIEAQRVKVKQ